MSKILAVLKYIEEQELIPAKFFKKLRYKVIKRDQLPHKVWGECVKCPLFPDCGEVPLIKKLA